MPTLKSTIRRRAVRRTRDDKRTLSKAPSGIQGLDEITAGTGKPSKMKRAHAAPSATSRIRSAPSSDSEREQCLPEKAARNQRPQRYLLRLYITGTTPASSRAIDRVRGVCEEHLRGRYELEVFDIYQKPALAKDEQIIATPTLMKVLPAPLRRFIGDLSKVEKVLFGLDLRERGS